MTKPLHALRLEPVQLADELARIWADDGAAVPLPLRAPAAAIDRLLRTLRPATLTQPRADNGEAETLALPDPVHVDDDIALIVSTSGSTGTPKGVALTSAALDEATRASIERLGCRPGERWILALPLHHIAGIQVLLRAWALGHSPVVVAPDAIGRSAGGEGEYVSLVPTQLRRLIELGERLEDHPTVLLGGAAAEPGLLGEARDAGLRLVVSYGMTETCGGCVYDGVPLRGVEVRLATDMRIQLRGPSMFHSYLGDPAGTAAVRSGDGWLKTNDLGRLESGRLAVLGRADDVVITGGENVPLTAVVARLREHPRVADAAAVGVPDDVWGERLVAVVVPSHPDDPPGLEELRRHVLRHEPEAFAPRALTLVDEVPRGPMGKPRRDALLEIVASR